MRTTLIHRSVGVIACFLLTSFFIGSFAGRSQAEQPTQKQRLTVRAKLLGLDPLQLSNPEAWKKKQAAQAANRRSAAWRDLPKAEPPAWFKGEVAEIERQQAPHTLAGVERDRRGGRSVEDRSLSPAVHELQRELETQRIPAALNVELPRRNLAPLITVPMPPKHEAPEEWLRSRTRVSSGDESRLSRALYLFDLSSEDPLPEDREPTLDAPSDHPLIVAKAQALGNDPVSIFNFVHDTIANELYYGSKKGAVGTLRESGGNDFDQASLLVALLRAAGIDARYELGTVALTQGQAESYSGARGLVPASSLLSSAGISNTYLTLPNQQGTGIKLEHVWVRAYVPTTAYRGIARPGTSRGWVNLAPALKRIETQSAVDLRDAVAFDFEGYLATPTTTKPSESYFSQLRSYIQTMNISCETLSSAQPLQTIIPQEYPILPADLPVPRVDSFAVGAELPSSSRHTISITGRTSQGVSQLNYQAPMVSLWGKSLSVIYEPADAEAAQAIADHGGLETTPTYLARLRAALKVDGVTVATGVQEIAGRTQSLSLIVTAPASGETFLEHTLTAGGVFAFVLDPGLIPADLISERKQRLAGLTGDAAEAERLHITGLDYFRSLGIARRQIAGLHWHRVYKDVEETMVSLDLKVSTYLGTPLAISRGYFILDAALIKSGNFSIDGDQSRRVQLARLVGFESSFLEHRAGEIFYGPRQFSAVGLLQLAKQAGVPVLTFSAGGALDALDQMAWPVEFEEALADAANRGRTIQAPVQAFNEPGFGSLYGYIATDPILGGGEYIVAFESGTTNALVNGGVGGGGPAPDGEGQSGCFTCGSNGPAGSTVHLLSGNYVDQTTDLTLPARGIPLAFTRTYSAQLGWHHYYGRRLIPQPDGSLTFVDATGVPRRFTSSTLGVWHPPPTFFQRIDSLPAGGFRMTSPDGRFDDFDSLGRLVSENDLNGNQVVLAYGSGGRISTITGTGGARLSLGYDATGNLTSVSDTAGRSVGFGYDPAGRLVGETDVLGATRTYKYDLAGRMIEKTDLSGPVTRISYDDIGRVVRIDDAEGGVRSYAYDLRNRRTVMTDPVGNVTLWELNQNAQVVRTVDAVGNEVRMEYDPAGNKIAVTDARGHLETMTYDVQGNLLTRLDAGGLMTVYTYEAHSRLKTVTDAAGTTTHVYDGFGNLLSTTDPAGETTSYTYRPGGLVETITRPGAATTTMGHDGSGNVVSIQDPAAGLTAMAYDSAGALISVQDPNGASRTMVVDAKGQVLVLRDAALRETLFTYDDNGNRTNVTDPEGGVTQSAYDKLHRLVATTDALGNVTRQEYDPEGRVTARVDARGFRTEMAYDAVGRLISTTDPEGHDTRMGYCAELSQQPCVLVDALGNITRVTEDESGREVARQDPLGNVVATEYDLLGRRVRAIDPQGQPTGFEYDAAGRLTKVVDALGGETLYGYDGRGNRTSVTDANGHTTVFGYDLANRLVSETTPIGTLTEFGYDPAGNRTVKRDGKLQHTIHAYDPDRRLTDITYASGTPAHFEYDSRGNRTLERNGDSERRMTYDPVGRLTTVVDTPTGRTITYTYDAAGNRTSMHVAPDDETTTYAWDGRGLLTRLTDPEGGVYRFGYDALGRRIRTLYPNGMTLQTTYDGASRVAAMVYRGRGGGIIESFGYAYDERGNRTAKVFADGTAELYGYDDLSRLVSVTYPTGRAVQYGYDAVGNRLEMVEGTATDPEGASCSGDQDCDGVVDVVDNCPGISNPDQTDSDAPSTPAGLVAAYNMENAATSLVAVDETGNNPGQYVQVLPVAGKYGEGIHIPDDNRTRYVKVPNSESLDISAQAVTVAAWINPTGWRGGEVVHKNQVFSLGTTKVLGATQSQISVRRGDGLLAYSIGKIPDNEWSHIAAVYDGTKIRLYINGVLDSEVTQSVVKGSFNSSVFVGCGTFWSTGAADACVTSRRPFVMLDEVGIWGRALTGAELQVAMAGPLRVGDGRGDACDACPNNADGTCAPTTCLDADGDGYGRVGASACSAGQPQKMDCDDTNAAVRPGGVEACDGVDNDCDGRVDEGCLQGAVTTRYLYNDFNQLVASGEIQACPGDTDCDGVPDAADNCPMVANGAQTNSDVSVPRTTAAGALGWWRFEEESGTVAEDETGMHPGALVGGVTRLAQGRFGRGLYFDGVDDGVNVASFSMPASQGPFSILAWVKHEVPTTVLNSTIVEVGSVNPGLYVFAEKLRLYPQALSGGVPHGQWTHVGYTWDGATGRYYVNGQETASNTSTPSRTGSGMKIGFGSQAEWRGELDEVGLWSRALGANEVAAHVEQLQIGDPFGDACDPCANSPEPTCTPGCTDSDGDGYGPAGASACTAGEPMRFDCNDANGAIYPGAGNDSCDGVDNDCDGRVDEDCPSDVTYEYDGNGNQTRGLTGTAVQENIWDARDRLVEVKAGNATLATYGYDTQNLRVYMNDASGERRILLDGIEELAEYEVASGVRKARYDHDVSRTDAVLAQMEAGAKSYAYTDALGSVYGLVDASGVVASRYSYDVYGARTASAETLATVWGYTGRRHESDGDMYYRSRYYNALTGTFLAEDVVNARALLAAPFSGSFDDENFFGRPQRLGRYSYAIGNPVVFRDPTGRFAAIAGLAGFGQVALAEALTASVAAAWAMPALLVTVAIAYHALPDPCDGDCRVAISKAADRGIETLERAFRFYVIYGDGDPTHYFAIQEHQRGLQRQLRRVNQSCNVVKSAFWHVVWGPVAYFPFPYVIRRPPL